MLPRLQLFEFNDLDFVPTAVRDTIVESLSRTLVWGRMLRGLTAPFAEFLAAAGTREVLDLGAGAGGPATVLHRELTRAGHTPPRFLLTDLHPRVEVWQGTGLDFVAEPVDATHVPPAIAQGRARSIINVLHHFPPALARAVLADAVRGGQGVFIAEAFERDPRQFANFAPVGVPALLANPLLSPRDKLAKAVLTWLTPLALAISAWDGLVSTLRIYSEVELRAMVEGSGWTWRYGHHHYPPFGRGYYFWGVPTG